MDAIVIGLAGLLAYFLRFGVVIPDQQYAFAYIFVTAAAPFVFHSLDLYDPERIGREPMQLQRLGFALLSLVFLTLAVGFVTKTSIDFSRIWMSSWGLLSILLLVIVRIVLWTKIRHWQAAGRLRRHIAVIGAGAQGQRLVRYFAEINDPSLVLIGVFDDRRTRVPNQVGDSLVRGTVGDLLEIVDRERVDEVIVALPWSAESRLLELLQTLRSASTHVRLSPEAIEFRFPGRTTAAIAGIRLLSVNDLPSSNWSLVIKRMEDQILSVLILMLIAPLLLTIAVAVKLGTRGPVLTRVRRYGFDNERFEAIQFRTHSIDPKDGQGKASSTATRTRVTRVGRFLRKAGLNELPQFYNVLRGEMSIVGPQARTEEMVDAMSAYEKIAVEYFARHRIKPGLTSWATVNGWGGDSNSPDAIGPRIEYELEYIEHWSVWFDLKIILMTPFVMYL